MNNSKYCTDDSCEGYDMYDICNHPDEHEDDEDYTSESPTLLKM